MLHNLSNTDRLVRLVIGVVLAALGLIYGGLLYDVLAIVGVVLILTAAFNFCPIYRLLGISTRKA